MKTPRPAAPPLAFAALAALAALAAITALAPATLANDADAIVGVWETAPTDKGYAHIEMTRYGDVYDGSIV